MLKLNHMSEYVKKQITQDVCMFYAQVAVALARLPQPCTMCGFCCHFAANKYRLYASNLEFIYLFDKYQAPPMTIGNDVCPFLQNGKCSVHDRRFLGCRTYFRLHTKIERIQSEEIYECQLDLLKELHRKYRLDWNYQDCMPVFQEEFGLDN